MNVGQARLWEVVSGMTLCSLEKVDPIGSARLAASVAAGADSPDELLYAMLSRRNSPAAFPCVMNRRLW